MTSAVSSFRTLTLDGIPPCTLHFSPEQRVRWIEQSVETKTAEIRRIVDELCAGLEAISLETHGPGIALPHEYRARSQGNMAGWTGVTVHFADREPFRHTESYSTMGGSPALQQSDPSTATTILLKALRKAKTLLQSGK